MSKIAIIPSEVILRSSELTFTEYRVLGYLYLRRNQRTKQCNPKQVDIAKGLGIDRGHVSRAEVTLAEKGWARRDESGNFDFEIPMLGRSSLPFVRERRPARNVAKSATNETPDLFENVAESGTPDVAESATAVADPMLRNPQQDDAKSATESCALRTESCEMRNKDEKHSLYSSLNKEEHSTEQRTEQGEAPSASEKSEKPKSEKPKRATLIPDTFMLTRSMREWAAKPENCPDVDLDFETKRFVRYFRTVAGAKALKRNWNLTWQNWMLKEQKDATARKSSRGNYRNERTDEDVLRESAEFYANYPEG